MTHMKPSQVASTLRRIAMNIETSKNPRRDLVASDLKRILAIISANRYADESESPDVSVRGKAARYNKSPEILTKLADDEDGGVRADVASNRHTPPEILAKLYDDNYDHRYIRPNLANNPNTPSEILTKLADHEDPTTRGSVARNPNTTVETLVKLSNDAHKAVRYTVAENSNTSTDILTKLSVDVDEWVREKVARNPNTPPEALTKLADDKIETVLYAVLDNPNTPRNIIIRLEDSVYGGESPDWLTDALGDDPSKIASVLRRIASKIEASKNPRRDLVASDLKQVLFSVSRDFNGSI